MSDHGESLPVSEPACEGGSYASSGESSYGSGGSGRGSASPKQRSGRGVSINPDTGEIEEVSSPHVGGEFIAINQNRLTRQDSILAKSWAALPRWQVQRIISSMLFDAVLGVIILIDLILQCYVCDLGAAEEEVPLGVVIVGYIFYGVYTLELMANVFVLGHKSCADKWILLDACIVAGGTVDLITELTGMQMSSMRAVRVLRIFRIFRLLRLFRKLRFLKELQTFVKMMTSCLKTIFWAFIFCFLLMTFWAMAMVEFIYPIVKDMADTWDDCPLCIMSTSSIMRANLLLFKTIVVGDEFGTLADPIINAHPWTAIIFVGSQLTVVFGVLNLITAVVVDEFADQRQKDIITLAHDLEEELLKDAVKLDRIFDETDTDNSDDLSLEELLHGAHNLPELASRLRVMDIDEADLEQLFVMMDNSESGTVTRQEFKGALGRWLQDSKTAARFVKYNMIRALEGQEMLKEMIDHKFDLLNEKLRNLNNNVEVLSDSTISGPSMSHVAASQAASRVSIESLSAKDGMNERIISMNGFANNPGPLGESHNSETQILTDMLAEASQKVELALAKSLKWAEAATERPALTTTIMSAAVRAQQEAITMASALHNLALAKDKDSDAWGNSQPETFEFSERI
eukprot:TRINITY_DN105814_c0_g1_i1.p1 TRINITY_DN105814_c0_g1~~TRINITY_DN105814_c0_g1_i1.p1  ORF type:complete len:630 (-),score=96.07 TRINITY_DN105814_c0_g1_i1:96-1985(-)